MLDLHSMTQVEAHPGDKDDAGEDDEDEDVSASDLARTR